MNNEFHLKNARRLAYFLDERFEILGIKIGFDPILDLIPEAGNFITTGMAIYIVYVAIKFELPSGKIARMVFNMLTDFIIGAVPFLGSIGTIFFRSNRMNIHILEEHLNSNAPLVEEGKIVT